MTIYREEIFGPVLSILPVRGRGARDRMANDTEYGLTNYIQTSDREAPPRGAPGALGHGRGQRQGLWPGLALRRVQAVGQRARGRAFGLHEFLEIKAVSGWE
jgi:aldehyde dehydrogenase (NAD+)